MDVPEHPDLELVTLTVEIKPGETLPRHLHDGLEAYYVVQGAMVQAGTAPAFQLQTGSSNVNLFRVPHAGFKVVGDTSLKFFLVLVVEKGKPLMQLVQ